MAEIRTLVGQTQEASSARSSRSVRFPPGDSGVDSASEAAAAPDARAPQLAPRVGRGAERGAPHRRRRPPARPVAAPLDRTGEKDAAWTSSRVLEHIWKVTSYLFLRCIQQRQHYYDNVQQLVDFMRQRSDPVPPSSHQQQQQQQQQQYQQQQQQQESPLPAQQRSQAVQHPAGVGRSTQTESVRQQTTQTTSGQPAAADEDVPVPRQFQAWAKSLQEERRGLAEQNDGLRTRVEQLNETNQGLERRLADTADRARQAETLNVRVQAEYIHLHSLRENRPRKDLPQSIRT